MTTSPPKPDGTSSRTAQADPQATLREIDKIVLDAQVAFLESDHTDRQYAAFLKNQVDSLVVDLKNFAIRLIMAEAHAASMEPLQQELTGVRDELEELTGVRDELDRLKDRLAIAEAGLVAAATAQSAADAANGEARA